MEIAPAAVTVALVEALPVASVNTAHVVPPPHAESVAPDGMFQTRVAPPRGVKPSAEVTSTRMGFGVSPPTGVAGFPPWISLMMSVGPAPNVSTSVMTEDEPVAGSMTVRLWVPS